MLILAKPAMTAMTVLIACSAVFGLICAIAVIILCLKVSTLEDEVYELRCAGSRKKAAEMYRPDIRVVPVAPAAAPAQQTPAANPNAGAGEMSVFDVPDRTAAKLMAIVAEETGLPPAQLRFISIREVK